MTRTIQEYGRAGVAGVHIEDQVAPKRCGHLEGKELVDQDEFVRAVPRMGAEDCDTIRTRFCDEGQHGVAA